MNIQKNKDTTQKEKSAINCNSVLIGLSSLYLLVNMICLKSWGKFNGYSNIGAFAGLSLLFSALPLIMRGNGVPFRWTVVTIVTILMFLSFLANLYYWVLMLNAV